MLNLNSSNLQNARCVDYRPADIREQASKGLISRLKNRCFLLRKKITINEVADLRNRCGKNKGKYLPATVENGQRSPHQLVVQARQHFFRIITKPRVHP